MKTIDIDGTPTKCEFSRSRDSWTWFYVLGTIGDSSGLRRIGEHGVPSHWWDTQDSVIITGGSRYTPVTP